VNRRLFLVGGLTAVSACAAPRSTPLSDPFRLGIASGDPRPDGMVLWTRLAPAPLEPDGGMAGRSVDVRWQLATDDAFTRVVASGTERAIPAEGHSVHAEPRGLRPGSEYFYRFSAAGFLSPVGRTRTAPAPGTAVGSLRFSFGSCAHYEQGYYHAYRHLAADEPDLVLFLGDYIYERHVEGVRRYANDEATTLEDYRLRYSQHRTDPALQAAHAVAPWLVVFDDHELKNNWWGVGSDAPDSRKGAAFQAFWENMPLPRSMRPAGPEIPLYRRIEWGTLARFHMLDTRQYRRRQATGQCAEIGRGDRTLTGAAQERWLLDGLTARRSGWDFLGQQVFFAQNDTDGDPSTCDVNADAWDGYPANRTRITQGWVDRGVRNPVVLTGDVHRPWANDLRVDYFDHDAPVVGTELVATSISSLGPVEPPDLRRSPHLTFLGNQRGYVRASLKPGELTAEFVGISDAREPSVTVPDGRPGVRSG
jgi:alkaline phosphatase D